MRSQTFLSNAFITASFSLCANKRRALGLRNKHFKAQRRQSATFVKVRKCFGSYLLRKIVAFAAPSSCGERSAAEEFCGRRSQEVTCFTRQPTDKPAHLEKLSIERRAPRGLGEQLKSTTATVCDEDSEQESAEDRTWSVWGGLG